MQAAGNTIRMGAGERKKRCRRDKMNEELKQYINVMSKKISLNKTTKNLKSCRLNNTKMRRSPTEDVTGAERTSIRRKMNASTPRRDGDREMQQDAELVSPI